MKGMKLAARLAIMMTAAAMAPATLTSAALAQAALAQGPAAPALPGMTPQENVANQLWALRSGLNVAALQCQFSPFLQTVPTYNALLRQHSDEMADAFKSMTGYFLRMQKGRAGERAFDTYATRANQSWATFDAQLAFCDAASRVGKKALAIPKGKLGEFATTELAGFRTSLGVYQSEPLRTLKLEWVALPDVAQYPVCTKKRC